MSSSVKGFREDRDRICSCPDASLPQRAQARSTNGDEAVCEHFFAAQEEFEPFEDLAAHAQQLREMQEKLEFVQNQLVELRQEVRMIRIERKTALPVEATKQRLTQGKHKQEEECLLVALARPMGFHKAKPLAALIVFRCCLQWRTFQADRTSVFERIIQVIRSQVDQQHGNNACLAYCLTNTVTLLYLLQRHIKPASGSSGSVKRVAAAAGHSIMGGLVDKEPMGGEESTHGGGVGGFRLVEAKYPALLFKQQLDSFVHTIFPMMRDNVKDVIKPMLDHCIYGGAHGHRAAASSHHNSRGAAPDSGSATSAQSKAWSDILHVFDDLLVKLRVYHVPKPVVQALFKQLFSFVNVQLFNQLLLRRECCSFSNGKYVKTGLEQVKSWIMKHGTEWVGGPWDELKYIRKAVTFLVIGKKPKETLGDITGDLRRVLSIQQLYRISSMYLDNKRNTETVSCEVLERMQQAMVENSSSASDSLLLDDDSTLPLAADDILAQMDDKNLYNGLPVPEPLKQASAGAASFAFLNKELTFSCM